VVCFTPKPLKKDKEEGTAILDVDGTATASVVAKSLKPEDQHKSLRERAEAEIDLQKKALKDFKVREDGIQERTIAGLPAVSLLAAYREDDKKMVMYAITVQGEKVDVAFSVSIAADRFNAYRKDFDKMVESAKLK
jgi:hypothetical protein